jgi:hypothetical protein
MKTLYVTSFSKTLFQTTGHLMIESFIKHKIGDLFVAYESFDFPSVIQYIENNNIKHTDIMEYKFLKDWLEDNKNLIPTVFGGSMPSPSVSGPPDGNKKMQKKVYDYWNKKASLWFRKVASLHYAIHHYPEYDNVVWIDSDCYFKKNLPIEIVENMLTKYDIFYHQGTYRNLKNFGFESGFIGFNREKGFGVVKLVSDFYTSKKYIDIQRWDDGYIFKIIIQGLLKKKKIKAIDLVDDKKPGKRLDAINKGIYADYVVHKKGIHKNLPNLGDDNKLKKK